MSQVGQLPRPVLVAVAGIAAVAVLLFATRRGGETATAPAPQVAATESAAPSQSAKGTASKAGERTSSQAQGGKAPSRDSARTLPVGVQRAVNANKVVVVLFWNAKGSDDRAVRSAVSGVSTRNGAVAKFTDTLGNFSRYTRLTGENAITQTPTVMVVDRKQRSEVATGYLDGATVDQLVVDALH
jgi:hypothetical protein